MFLICGKLKIYRVNCIRKSKNQIETCDKTYKFFFFFLSKNSFNPNLKLYKNK